MESRFHKILIWILAGMLVLAGSLKLSAQTNQVRGVISEKSGNPLAGVDVLVKGTSRGVTSDANGNYSIASSKGEVLVFSFLGFISQEVKVGDSQVINVVLQEDVQALNEAIAIGYGTIKGSRVTNSISKISGEDLVDRPVARIDQALQGKVSGVYVQEVSGAPGKSLSVRVRGTGSINYGSSPLYVVDGYPISGDLNNINPSDIESIEVLKDAASAAIYGSRGSNGVVLVTTKQGKKGSPQINLNISFGIQKRFSKVDVLNRDEYIEYAIEERTNSYIYSGGDLSVPEDKRHNYKYAIDPVWKTIPSHCRTMIGRTSSTGLLLSRTMVFPFREQRIKPGIMFQEII